MLLHLEVRGHSVSQVSLYHVGPNDQTQVMGLSTQCLFPLDHFTGRPFNTGPVGAVET